MGNAENLLSIRDLKVSFDIQGGSVEAVKGVSFTVAPGRVVALVGESASPQGIYDEYGSVLLILVWLFGCCVYYDYDS